MSYFSLFTILTLVGSLGYCLMTVYQLLIYNRRYRMTESKYTKLFGVITKEEIAFMYIIVVVAMSVFGVWILITIGG